jgi:carbonic anhydrase/acetyltransferase-like protein (isoleucine patch superfamily)
VAGRRGKSPNQIDASVFIAKTATVVGEVAIGKSSSVWFSAVVRGDIAPVVIGEASNIQDGAVLHVGHGFPCLVGNRVTVGHGAIVHGATVKDDAMIGIGAIVLNGAVIGEGSLVAAGSVVTENTIIPPGSLVMGIPGRPVRPVTDEQRGYIRTAAGNYVGYALEYRRSARKAARPKMHRDRKKKRRVR